jgi:predicted amidophosphoribosyltransferase
MSEITHFCSVCEKEIPSGCLCPECYLKQDAIDRRCHRFLVQLQNDKEINEYVDRVFFGRTEQR